MTDQEREREKKKSRLRSRMLVTGQDDMETGPLQAEDEDGYRGRLIRHRIKKILLIAVPLILLAGCVLYLYYSSQN